MLKLDAIKGSVLVFALSPEPCALNLLVNTIMQRILLIIISIFIPLLSTICEAKREHLIQGRTMGTTYHVKIVSENLRSTSGIKAKIETRLKEINRSMSTYQKDSEISRFNKYIKIGQQFNISRDFFDVMKVAQRIYQLSEGAWDGTVNPLVDLWGFGRGKRLDIIPSEDKIAALLLQIGFGNIEIREPGFLLKNSEAVSLDLSSIAKGYGVDQIAELIRKEGFENYLVEIGGEVFASGYRQDGKQWRIGINRPKPDAAFDDVYKVVNLYNRAFATSGDYRNFFVLDGTRYSHIIDPRTGYPVSNGVVSVTIIAPDCTLADGLATAIMVLGVEKGIELINRLDAVEGLIVIEKKDGELADYFSSGFIALQ